MGLTASLMLIAGTVGVARYLQDSYFKPTEVSVATESVAEQNDSIKEPKTPLVDVDPSSTSALSNLTQIADDPSTEREAPPPLLSFLSIGRDLR